MYNVIVDPNLNITATPVTDTVKIVNILNKSIQDSLAVLKEDESKQNRVFSFTYYRDLTEPKKLLIISIISDAIVGFRTIQKEIYLEGCNTYILSFAGIYEPRHAPIYLVSLVLTKVLPSQFDNQIFKQI